MKRLIVIAMIVVGLVLVFAVGGPDRDDTGGPALASDQRLAAAFSRHESGLQVQGGGTVIAVLPDDNKGSHHQRFVLRLESGQTLLIAHNIDLAPRIERLREGDFITFSGEYEWNPEGGVVHWTHRHPAGRHADGWLQRAGQIYR
ncbi:DUF3465 domain-containing protein [Algiphilus sp. W345]|uniref:DUF3465 domain-containing protein n=1 Tax=Banduia mediterranea TaxID=3075609 RepID=A0ABU2WJV7_9GAMM|nr:DUF3465 domain-containing protein [Algiphilus sp. W345]MDT0498142.1 DUF3465 domain-containing protein [Algiphilus sp. W345]